MTDCYIGRGTLYARKLDVAGAGFVKITGESEVTLNFVENGGEVVDARYGKQERVDWYVKSITATLEAEVFDQSESALAMLLKGTNEVVGASVGASYALPGSVSALALYPLPRSNITSLAIQDALALPLVANTDYKLDAEMGLVEFLTPGLFTQPFTATYSNAPYSELGLATQNTIALEVMFRGFNRKSKAPIKATFYHAELRIADAMKLISKEFANLPFKCELIADFSHHTDATLSHYGKVTSL